MKPLPTPETNPNGEIERSTHEQCKIWIDKMAIKNPSESYLKHLTQNLKEDTKFRRRKLKIKRDASSHPIPLDTTSNSEQKEKGKHLP